MNRSNSIIVNDENTRVEYYNGTTFIVRKVPGSPKFTAAAFIAAGSYDDVIPGTAHFFEHLPFGLSKNFSDESVFRYMKDRKGEIGAYTNYDYTAYYGEVAKESEKEALFAISDIACRAIVDDARVSREKDIIVSEIAHRAMDPDKSLWGNIAHAAYGTHCPVEVIGKEETVFNVQPNDIRTFASNNYFADRMVVAMEGDCEPDRLFDCAKELFQLPRGPKENERKILPFQPHVEVIQTLQPATRTCIVFPTWPAARHTTQQEIAASNILGNMLFGVDGPLMRRLRFDERLIYGIGVKFSDHQQTMAMDTVMFDAAAGNVRSALNGLGEVIRDFGLSFSYELFNRTKEYFIHQADIDIQKRPEFDAHGIANVAYKYGRIDARNDFLNAVKKTTPEDVMAAAGRYLSGPDVSLLYMGKIQTDFPNHSQMATLLGSSPVRSAEMDRMTRGTVPPSKLKS